MPTSIAKIELRNFGPHEHTVFDLGPLTSIVGTNDVGKSWLFYAVEMVLENEEFPAHYLTYGTKEGSVKITFDDGEWIERSRTGSKQQCKMSGHPKPYDTIKDIKDIVQSFTGFVPFFVDKSDRTPESLQLIPIDAGNTYLVSGTSAEGVLRRVNRLMAGAGIETAKMRLDSELKALNTKAKTDKQKLDESAAVLAHLEGAVYDEVETSTKDVDRILGELSTMRDDLQVLEDAEALLPHATAIKNARKAQTEATASMDGFEAVLTKLNEHVATLRDVQATEEVIRDAMATLDSLYDEQDGIKAELEKLEPLIAEAEKEAAVLVAKTEIAQETIIKAARADWDEPMIEIPKALGTQTYGFIQTVGAALSDHMSGQDMAEQMNLEDEWSKCLKL